MTGVQGIAQFSLPWLILELTDSVGQLGFVIFLQGVAWSFVALIGGVLASLYVVRRNRYRSPRVVSTPLGEHTP